MSLKNGEYTFQELFFSRTDLAGKIISGNNVFQRVSVYGWGELIGRPHNIIRHEDMPRAVFYLFWDIIKQQKPVAAYVKNKAKDGAFYWVFALALPIDGGYVSIRFKPSTEIMKIVCNLYADLLVDERVSKVQPKAGVEKILTALKGLGFDSYEDFMRFALMKELDNRDFNLGIKNNESMIANLESLLEKQKVVSDASEKIFKEYAKNKFISLNLNIEASHVGERGISLAKVAEQFQKMIEEIQIEIKTFSGISDEANKALKENQFLVCAAKLQKEMIDFFATESRNANVDVKLEADLLNNLAKSYRDQVEKSLRKTVTMIDQLNKTVESLLGMVNGLEIVRITGKIESARGAESLKQFETLLNELKQFVLILKTGLSEIHQSGVSMSSISKKILLNMKLL